MSFSPELRTLRNGEIYSTMSRPKMSMSAENTAGGSALRDPERIEGPDDGILHELIEEGIKANLRPLIDQLSTLTQLLNLLIQESATCNSPTADTHTQRTHVRRSSSREARASRALPAREIGGTGSPPDTY